MGRIQVMKNNNIFKSKATSKVLIVYNKYMLIFTQYPDDEYVEIADDGNPCTYSGKVKFTCVGFNPSTQVSLLLAYELFPCELTLSQWIKSKDVEELASMIYGEEDYLGCKPEPIPYTE
jgi:hypothetical protein